MEGYEEWAPSKRDYWGYQVRDYACYGKGHLDGHEAILSTRVNAGSMTDAIRMFTDLMQKAGIVNWTKFDVVEEKV